MEKRTTQERQLQKGKYALQYHHHTATLLSLVVMMMMKNLCSGVSKILPPMHGWYRTTANKKP